MRKISGAVVILGLLGIAAAQGQEVRLPRAKTPLVLSDFSKPEALGAWTGLKTSGAALDGQPAMQFTFPRYVQGENEWPAIYLSYDGGKGYPTDDWSHYARVAFDVRTDSDKSADIALELRNTAGQNGPTVHFDLAPGKTNRLELALADLSKQLKLDLIEQIVFFTTRPTGAYTITLSGFQLLPGDKPPPVRLDLAYPNYRGLVFPPRDRATVTVTTQLAEYDYKPGQLTLTVAASGGGKKTQTQRRLSRELATVSLPTSSLPAGEAQLSATVTGPRGEKLASEEWGLRKLTPAEARGLRVFVDENNNTIVDGKPFFPLGWYGGHSMSQMLEIADSPFNCVLDYGGDNVPRADMLAYLDALQAHGLREIYCLNDVYPAAKYFEGRDWEGVSGNQSIADAVMAAYRHHPAILAWYLNDELPRSMVADLTEYYRRARENDPNHPCYIVLCAPPEFRYFTGTTDILGADPYPMPSGSVSQVSDWADQAEAAVGGRKPVWMVPQAFAWYQYTPEGSDRGRVPTEAELKTGRAPTYEEERCMTYLALVHGARGLIYYCYYDLRVLPQYEEMWGSMKQIGGEVKTLMPVLLSSQDLGQVRFEPAAAPIHTKLKRCGGREYLIAVNAGAQSCEATFDLRRRLPAEVQVMFEGTTANTRGARMTASFRPLEVHVYDLGPV